LLTGTALGGDFKPLWLLAGLYTFKEGFSAELLGGVLFVPVLSAVCVDIRVPSDFARTGRFGDELVL